jgi:hypothetical protein
MSAPHDIDFTRPSGNALQPQNEHHECDKQ